MKHKIWWHRKQGLQSLEIAEYWNASFATGYVCSGREENQFIAVSTSKCGFQSDSLNLKTFSQKWDALVYFQHIGCEEDNVLKPTWVKDLINLAGKTVFNFSPVCLFKLPASEDAFTITVLVAGWMKNQTALWPMRRRPRDWSSWFDHNGKDPT